MCDYSIEVVMDNSEEISAFAAFSAKRKPPKTKKELKKKSKLKVKKKKKTEGCNVNSVMNALINATEALESDNINEKSKKHTKKKKLIKSILGAQKESIFKDCSVTTKVDNLFIKENGVLNNDKNKMEKTSLNQSTKLKKKKKMTNDDALKKIENNKSIAEAEENGFFLNDDEVKTEFTKQVNTKFLKSVKKNRVKGLNKKTKLPDLIHSDSVKVGEEVFSWLLSPLGLKDFFENCWEQKPLHIEHNDKNYFKCLCTLEDFKAALREHDMFFTKNIDVTSYTDGKRSTENPKGKAKPSIVWDFYNNGRSIRLLNPQTFIPKIRLLNTALQEFFYCFVGANIYLTPPGTQGFAPHYDDIEAFVLQLEGEKHWKLYNPRSPEEVLPRESSRDFMEHDIGEPILEVILQPGDLLYFPRGIIHQAKCLPHTHSLHITVSCYQKNSWADLLEKILPVALKKAINEDVELRKGLPLGYLNSLGLIYCDQESPLRQKIINKFEELAKKILKHCPIDAGVDQLGANFTYDALPPSLSEVEKLYGANRDCKVKNGKVLNALKNSSDKNVSVKLIRATSVRLVSEQEEMVLYYTTDNSLVYHEHEVSSVIISTQWAQAVEYLIHAYPKFVEMKNLPVSNKINKPGKWKRIVEFVYFLWQKGLLLFDQPLKQICS